MTVGRRLAEDRPAKIEGLDDRSRPEVEMAIDQALDPLVGNAPVPNVSIDTESGLAIPMA